MKIIIMCAGKGTRWKGDNRKQLCVVDNETILDRTIRLCKELGYDNISVTYYDYKYIVGVNQIQNTGSYEIDRFYHVKGEVVYLYGDVYYTKEALYSILNDDGVFFGRSGASDITGKKYGEIFAVKEDGDVIKQHVDKVKIAFDNGDIKRCIGWELYKSYYNIPLDKKPILHRDRKHIVPINDLTDDFDTVEEYNKFLEILK